VPLKTEADLERACSKLASFEGCKLWKWSSPGLAGVPDRLLFKPHGELIIVEFKTPKGTGILSAMQERRIAELRELGFRVEVIDNIEEFKALL